MAQKARPFATVSFPSSGGDIEGAGGGGRYIPSPDQIRKWARESVAGGTTYCAVCKERFSMTHMRFCKISFFVDEWVCLDCKKTHGYQVIK